MNITVSLETAKKLKEAGWDKECELSYYNNPTTADGYILHWIGNDQRSWKNELNDRYPNEPDHFIEAPTIQEILESLSEGTILYKANGIWIIKYLDATIVPYVNHEIENKSPVEAAAMLWMEIKKGE